jgi:hypothetical protein
MKRKVPRRMMFIFMVNLGLFISFFLVAVTGILKFPRLLPALGVNMLRFPIGTVSAIHDWAGVAMLVFVFFHILFYYRSFVAMVRRIFKRI